MKITGKIQQFLLWTSAGNTLIFQWRAGTNFLAKWWWVLCALIAWKLVLKFLSWLYSW